MTILSSIGVGICCGIISALIVDSYIHCIHKKYSSSVDEVISNQNEIMELLKKIDPTNKQLKKELDVHTEEIVKIKKDIEEIKQASFSNVDFIMEKMTDLKKQNTFFKEEINSLKDQLKNTKSRKQDEK
jgi:predicted  nucleic acid-binding Zn-ribbon protein